MRLRDLIPAIALVALVAACGGEFADCEDAICRSERVLPGWEANPDAVLEVLPTLDGVEQVALVRAIAAAWPTDVARLCEGLPSGVPAAPECARLRGRPHLSIAGRARVVEQVVDREGGGTASGHLPLPDLGPAPWEGGTAGETAAAVGDCGTDATCVRDAAIAFALARDIRSAGLACRGGHADDESAANECLFQAAEALAQKGKWPAFKDVLTLCTGAGWYATPCLDHTMAFSVPDISPADRPGRDSVDEARDAVAFMQEVIGEDLAPYYRDQFWSRWTMWAFQNAREPDGTLLKVLPEEAAPHVRMAAAWVLLDKRATLRVTLEGAVAGVAAALAEQGSLLPTSPRRHPSSLRKTLNLWPDDLVGSEEGTLKSIFCLGPGRRATSADPALDLRIAVLEAAGRVQRPPATSFFLDAALDPDEDRLVRWTAARIAAQLAPEDVAGKVSPTGDPLLDGRLVPQ